jgi:hypothetical protein
VRTEARAFDLFALRLLRRGRRKGDRKPRVPPVRAVLRRELPVGFHIGDALDLVGDGKEIIELWAVSGDSRLKRAERMVAANLLEVGADEADVDLPLRK